MRKDQEAFKQVATTLATHFDGLYYVDIETNNYVEFVPSVCSKNRDFLQAAKTFLRMLPSAQKSAFIPMMSTRL